MVVCKCRKATKLYCFVHKVPVCGECICFREHQICVVRAYSEWVIDGEYDWPPKCCLCQDALEEGTASQTTRLGCLHIVHTNCLISYINKFPLHTAPAGYVCPACSIPIWPPKCVKDSGSQLHSQLKEAIMQSGLEKNLFGNYPVSLPTKEHHAPPPAFASDPLIHIPGTTTGGEFNANSPSSVLKDQIASEGYTAETGGGTTGVSDIVEVDGSNSAGNFIKSSDQVGLVDWNTTQPGATTRKGAFHNDRANHEVSYYADDEDGNSKKYTRRGPFRLKFLRALLPFWSTALPTLPVTVPPRKDALNADDLPEGRSRHQRSSRVDPRKLLLVLAIMACMATMGVLYYRLVQRGLGEELLDDEKQ